MLKKRQAQKQKRNNKNANSDGCLKQDCFCPIASRVGVFSLFKYSSLETPKEHRDGNACKMRVQGRLGGACTVWQTVFPHTAKLLPSCWCFTLSCHLVEHCVSHVVRFSGVTSELNRLFVISSIPCTRLPTSAFWYWTNDSLFGCSRSWRRWQECVF